MADPVVAPPAPAAPAAPVPAPTPSPTPAAPATPASSSRPDPILAFDKQLTEAFDKAAPLANKPDAPAKPAEPAKPPEKPADPPKPDANKQTPTIKVPKELRAELDRVSGELTTKNKQISDMETKIKDFEAKGKDTTVLTERLATLEKQVEAKDAELRGLRHEASPEFKQKFEAPFNKAAERAKKFFETLDVADAETGTNRKGSMDDLVELTRLYAQAPNKAMAKAEQLFGNAASLVMPHIGKLNDLEEEAKQAIAEEKASWKQRTTEEEAKSIAQREQLGKLYEDVKKQLGESVDDYKDDPTDKELGKVREDAFKLFDEAPKDLQERVIKNAHIRHRFAALPVIKLKLLRAQKEISDLKSELETYKVEPPDPSRRRGGKESSAGSDLTWEQTARKELT